MKTAIANCCSTRVHLFQATLDLLLLLLTEQANMMRLIRKAGKFDTLKLVVLRGHLQVNQHNYQVQQVLYCHWYIYIYTYLANGFAWFKEHIIKTFYVRNNFCISQNPHFVWFWEIGQSHLASNSSNCCFRAVWSCAAKKSRWTVPPTRYNAYLLIDLGEIVSMLRFHFRCFMVPFETEVTIIWESLLCQHDIEETGVWSLLLAW